MRPLFVFCAGVALALGLASGGTTLLAQPEQKIELQHYSVADTPLSILLADPAAREILRRHVPLFADNSRAALIGNDSLRSIQGYALSVLSDDVLAKIDAELAKLPPVRMPVPAATTDEAKVKPYRLPDPLRLANGRQVTRPEGVVKAMGRAITCAGC